MRCNVDGQQRPQVPVDDWVDDGEWGLVHKTTRWHTVTGTWLRRLKDGAFVPDQPTRREPPEHPLAPAKTVAHYPGHPGLPSRQVTPEEWKDAE